MSPLGGRQCPPRGDAHVPLTIQEPSNNHPYLPPPRSPRWGKCPATLRVRDATHTPHAIIRL